jgi:hypothetical protein
MIKFAVVVITSSAVAFLATGGYALLPQELYDPACNIKGNISIGSGEKIYHVPGQHDYVATNIRRDYGERWFCTEDAARAAGWRMAGR